MNMADRIKQRMEEIGMTQDQLATAASLTQPAIFKLLSGKTRRTTRLAEIAKAINVRPEWLVTGSGRKEPSIGEHDQVFLDAYHDLPEDEKEAINTLVFRRSRNPKLAASPNASPSPSRLASQEQDWRAA